MAPRSLTMRQKRAWRAFQSMRNQLTAHLARQLAQQSGLTDADYAVLVEVSEAPGRRTRLETWAASWAGSAADCPTRLPA